MPVNLYRAAQQFLVYVSPGATSSTLATTTPLFANKTDPNTSPPYGDSNVPFWAAVYSTDEIDAALKPLQEADKTVAALQNQVATLQTDVDALSETTQQRISQRIWIATKDDTTPRPQTDITIPTTNQPVAALGGLGADLTYTDAWISATGHLASLPLFDQLDVIISGGLPYLIASPIVNKGSETGFASVALEIRIFAVGHKSQPIRS